MRGSIRLFEIFGISINIHVTFLLLLVIFLMSGIKSFALIVGIFVVVTMHELCHSLMAKRFGIEVREITLLPIGGLASMSKMPDKPSQEFLISLAGPMFNLAVIAVFYVPMRLFLGDEVLFHSLSTATWPLTLVYIYCINLVLAFFNLIPAFPMDGGRLLRAILAKYMDYKKATRIAVGFGHIFALIFAYFGIVQANLILVAIAIFIYMAASGEELQVDVKETLKKIRIRDILSPKFLTLTPDTTLAGITELIFREPRQEDFPVVDAGKCIGFVTRQDIMADIHQLGADTPVAQIMRKDYPRLTGQDALTKAHASMEASGIKALPVFKEDEVIGVVTIEDIGRVYAMMSAK